MTQPPLYKYLDVRGAKLTLGNKTFRHAKPSDFNDLKKLARMIRTRVESKDADSGDTEPDEVVEVPPHERPSSSLHTAP